MTPIVPLRCEFCGHPINAQHDYKKVTAYSRKGQTGGSDVVLREPTGEWACTECIDKKRRGVDPKRQPSLL